MQWISLSDYSIIYGICENKSYSDTISRLFKKNLASSADSVSYLYEIKKHLQSIFSFFEQDKPTDRKVAFTIPSDKAEILFNHVETGLEENQVNEVLDWRVKNSLPDSDKLFIQHYFLNKKEETQEERYLTVAVQSELRNIIAKTALSYGFEPVLLDLGILSAYKLLSKSFPLQAYENWGLWKIGKENDVQNLLVFNDGEMYHISFISDNSLDITVLQNTNPQKYDTIFLENLMNNNFDNLNFEKFFIYSTSPNNIFVQKRMDANAQQIINPLPVLSKYKVRIEQKYLTNKLGVSQFSEIAGLISRF
ncbi:MAG: hypothetical protein JXQ65_11565 [Candidatus Marinimicrobia bacterium]|nr:hypothetical protein [Candidatus Neomarinimicrobiota bacterium]